MHSFDFFSESPNIFIFQKEYNKTNFGGILFSLFTIIMFLISLAYILDYAINEKYTYEALTFYNYTDDYEQHKKMNDDIELNPLINVTISLRVDNLTIYSDVLGNLEKDHIDEKGYSIYTFQGKVSSLVTLTISFKCGEDRNCSSLKQYIKENGYEYFGNIIIVYPGFKIQYDDSPPIYKDNPKTVRKDILLYEGQFNIITFEWEAIKFKDQKSLFDTLTNKKTEYIGGHIKNDRLSEEFIRNGFENNIEYVPEFGYLYYLSMLQFKNNHNEYLLYKRKKIEPLDVLANIGALFSTIKNLFSIFFSFYSKNFNNYKILGKILTSPKEPIKKIGLIPEFSEISSSTEKEEEKKSYENDENNNEPLIDNTTAEKELNIKGLDTNKNINEINENETSSVLNKLHFFEFLFNNIYCKCCKKRRNQEIINMTNDILYNYLSIDSLLYNQIKLENLLKDYKWNNKSLNDIQNNKMIIKLKNY